MLRLDLLYYFYEGLFRLMLPVIKTIPKVSAEAFRFYAVTSVTKIRNTPVFRYIRVNDIEVSKLNQNWGLIRIT